MQHCRTHRSICFCQQARQFAQWHGIVKTVARALLILLATSLWMGFNAHSAHAQADINMDKRVSNTTPNVGDTLSFTLTVTNTGTIAASGVAITDVVQSGFSYQPASIGGSGANDSSAPTLTWSIPTLGVGISETLTFQAQVNASGVYSNVAQAAAPEDPTLSSSTVVTVSPNAALVINEIDYNTPSIDDAEFIELRNNESVGVNLDEYDLTLINDVGTIYDIIDLPDVVLAAGDYYVICGDAANVSNCDLDVTPDTNLVQNGPADAMALVRNGTVVDTVSYDGDAPAPYTEGSGAGLVDTGTADIGISRDPDGVDTDQNNADFGQRCITPGAANAGTATNCTPISVDLSVESPVIEGNSGAITLTLSAAATQPVTVTLIYTDATADATDYTSSTITVVIDAGFTGFITAFDTTDDVTDESDETFQIAIASVQNATDVSTPQTVTINDDENLAIAKSVSDSAPAVGDLITFTVAVTNIGATTATNVVITDGVPGGFTYDPASISGGDSRNDSGAPTLLWTINSLPVGASTTVQFRAAVNANGPYGNTAVADASHTTTPVVSPPVALDSLFACQDALVDILDWNGATSTWTPDVDGGAPDQLIQTFSYEGRSYTLEWQNGANGGTPATTTSAFHPDMSAAGITGGLDQTFIWQLTLNDGPLAHVHTELHDFDRSLSGATVWQERVIIRGFNGATPVTPTVYPLPATAGTPLILYNADGSVTVYGNGDNSDIEIYFSEAIDRIQYEMGWGPDSETTSPNFNVTTRDLSSCVEFGDAPAIYNTLLANGGASHHPLATGPRLGATVDADSNGFGDGADDNNDATDDDSTDTDDEDGIALFPVLSPLSTSYSVDAQVTNDAPNAATLLGWIDFNVDGVMAASEIATATVAPGTANGTSTLTWNSPVITSTGNISTYTRFRITTDALTDTQATTIDERTLGVAADGEVEDYAVHIADVTLTNPAIVKSVSNTTPNVGDVVTFTLLLTNSNPTTLTNVVVTDVVQSGFSYQMGSIAGTGANETSAPTLVWDIPTLGAGSSETLTFQAQVNGTGVYTNVAQAASTGVATPTVSATVVVSPNGALVVNEIDYDTPGADDAEFVELRNNDSGSVNLDEYELVLFNGATSTVYDTIDLPDVVLMTGAYYVICGDASNVANCDLEAISSIQNGAADAVALVRNGTIVDTVSYDGDAAAPYTEGSGAGLIDSDVMDLGIARYPDGVDTDQNNVDWSPRCITPGAANTAANANCNVIPNVTLSASTPLTEGASGLITATLDTTTTQDVTVTLVYTDGTADSSDYVTSTVTLVVPAGQTSATLPFTATDDGLDEADETFDVGIASVQNGADVSTPQMVTILDNDAPSVTLNTTTPIGEGNNGDIIATLDAPAHQPVTVTLAFTDGTASVSDYAPSALTIVIPAGQTSASIPITAVDDTLDEPNETLQVGIVSVQNANDASTTRTITILDDDMPNVSLDVTTPVVEGDNGSTTVTLDTPATQNVTVTLVYTDSTAGSGDYTPAALTVVIPAGQTSASASFATPDDATAEPNERFDVAIASVQNANDASTPQTVTILDDDAPSVTLNAATPIGEGNSGEISAVLDMATTQPVTVTLVYTDDTTSADDYASLPSILVIPPGETSVSAPFNTIDDTLDETSETLHIAIADVQNGIDASTPRTVTILDDDVPLDSDDDGVLDVDDVDDDNDGIPDTVEQDMAHNNGDTDGDGILDHLDLDSDGDGLSDLEESGLSPEQMAQLDQDNDGVIDGSNPVGDNGMTDAVETTPESGQMDHDGDGVADMPVDSDNDGDPDVVDPNDVIVGIVWDDQNGDGMRQENEPRIQNATVVLYTGTITDGTAILTATTTITGWYRFDALPGALYTVEYVAPEGLVPTLANQGGNENSDSDGVRVEQESRSVSDAITVAYDDMAHQRDAGFVAPASLTVMSFNDQNQNGARDAGEPLVPGALVILYDAEGNEVMRVTVGDSGEYTFTDLMPDTYSVEVIPPAGYQNSTDQRQSLVLSPGMTSNATAALIVPTALDEIDEPAGLNRHLFLPVIAR